MKKNENEKNENEKNVRKSFYEIYPISNSVNRGLHFVREKLYQRDVEITINDVDRRSGIFRGKVYFQGEDITISLLEEGYAMINVDTAANMEEYKIYKEAENKAKNHEGGPKNMWEGYDPAVEQKEKEDRDKEREERKKRKRKDYENSDN